jgi:2-polyprenyl-3-methyl-5-hydroxy-6-metoxy-1,4-benzoquinol methylase
MKTLVAIVNYGTGNDGHLSRVLDEFRGMPYDSDIVVTTNVSKNLGPDVEVVVGLPSKDPRSLAFAHKRILAERLDSYDLFIYCEDDNLMTQRNIDAFLWATDALPANDIAGFMRTETDPMGRMYFPEVHYHYHWDPASVWRTGRDAFAYFSDEHAGCYILTKDQLRVAIASGGFLVGMHQHKYGPLETAATDPYTQCGFRKMMCISRFEDFLIPHLSNKGIGYGISTPGEELYTQLRALRHISDDGHSNGQLFRAETNLYSGHLSKSYYEPCQEKLISLVQEGARHVLSIGCGWGETEKHLIEKGIRVKAIPMDSVIAASAESRGVEIVYGDAKTARKKLAGERFDCVLLSNVLHLVRDPVEWLVSFSELLNPGGQMVASVPNLSKLRRLSRGIRLRGHPANPRSYEQSGVHVTTGRIVRGWFRQAGLRPDQVVYGEMKENARVRRMSAGLAKSVLGSDVYVSGILASPRLPRKSPGSSQSERGDELRSGSLDSDATISVPMGSRRGGKMA